MRVKNGREGKEEKRGRQKEKKGERENGGGGKGERNGGMCLCVHYNAGRSLRV